ncbi:lipase member H [Caerostris extrusa]|uniref:Lipase member H n=1 Tax=Caerostris extrusa TaxID=172846 RepID=A0AAV4T7T8_CAEEX|nr:lipase member H [Caerostris extrusa]
MAPRFIKPLLYYGLRVDIITVLSITLHLFISDSPEYPSCNHDAAPYFFLQSINKAQCLFRSVQCPNYDDFLDGQCPPDSSKTDLMGLPAQQIPGLAPKSKFYLRTMADLPYCLQDGDEPA